MTKRDRIAHSRERTNQARAAQGRLKDQWPEIKRITGFAAVVERENHIASRVRAAFSRRHP